MEVPNNWSSDGGMRSPCSTRAARHRKWCGGCEYPCAASNAGAKRSERMERRCWRPCPIRAAQLLERRPEGRFGGAARRGRAVARLRQRSVDLPTGEAPDRPLVRCFVPCRPCVAAVAESRLHSAKALASGGGTRRRGHRDLGPQGLATHQKKTAQLGRTSFSRMKPAFC